MNTEHWYGLENVILKGKRIFLLDTNVLLGGWRRGDSKDKGDLERIVRSKQTKNHLADILESTKNLLTLRNIKLTKEIYNEIRQVLRSNITSNCRGRKRLKRVLEETINYLGNHKNELIYCVNGEKGNPDKRAIQHFISRKFKLKYGQDIGFMSYADISLINEAFMGAGYGTPKPVDVISSDYALALGLQILFDDVDKIPLPKKPRQTARWKCLRLYSRDYNKDFQCSFDSLDYLKEISEINRSLKDSS